MFFISKKLGDLYGVKDTSDNTEEFYTAKKLIAMYKKVKEKGIQVVGINYYDEKWHINPVSRVSILYIPVACDNNLKVTVDKYVRADGFKEKLGTEVIDMNALSLYKASGATVEHLERLHKASIIDGDTIVFIPGCNCIVKEDIYNEVIADSCDTNKNIINLYGKLFNSDKEALLFCKQHKLHIANEFSSNNSRKYWAEELKVNFDYYLVDQVIILYERLVPLWGIITSECVPEIEDYFGKLHNTYYSFTQGTGSFNPKGMVFHFNLANKMLSFDISPEIPEDENLKQLSIKTGIAKYGLYISRANIHASKKYKSDIQFYAD